MFLVVFVFDLPEAIPLAVKGSQMNLKFVATTKPVNVSPAIQRRQRLVRRLDQQSGFIRQMADGRSPRAAWVWLDDAGNYFLPIRYGRQQLELKKGMFAIQCQTLDECGEALTTVRRMVLAGEFDEHLSKASGDIRKRFQGS